MDEWDELMAAAEEAKAIISGFSFRDEIFYLLGISFWYSYL
jgi:hypothetical protein